jgi:hypothetical protein
MELEAPAGHDELYDMADQLMGRKPARPEATRRLTEAGLFVRPLEEQLALDLAPKESPG